MAAAIRGTLLRHLIITVLVLADRQWTSLCGSIDSSLESHGTALKKIGGATTPGFKLLATGASSITFPTFDRESRRLLLEHDVEIKRINSSKEVEILLAFKSEITGDPLGVLKSWRANDSDPCRWPGVGCSPSSKDVITLNLQGLKLVGTVSTLLGQLLNLQHLDLSQNYFHSSIPGSLGNCSNLLRLNMSFNEMNEDVPPQVGNLHKLQTLDLYNNNLTGGIPETLANCSALRHLDLGKNYIDGGIPSKFDALFNLQFLSLDDNSISGSIPQTMGNCSSLTKLSLSSNLRLGGKLPFQFGELIHLEIFSILFCSFQGNFPTWTLNLTSMKILQLEGNQFVGQLPQAGWRQLSQLVILELGNNIWDGSEIPRDIGSLTNLTFFDIEYAYLVGEIPRSIFNITSLNIIDLAENHLTGAIPDDIGLLRNLAGLYLAENAFSGIVPSSISNCSLLQDLELGENPGFDLQDFPSWIGSLRYLTAIYFTEMNLQGEIPIEIGQLSQLTKFLVWTNSLTGVIPASLGNFTALIYFAVDENQLTGQVPPELGQLSQLGFVNIGNNFFSSGPLPTFIYNLTSSLVEILLDNNQYNGKLDGDFGSFQLLQAFSANNTSFEGPMPESFSNCSNLFYLDLGGNNLSGEIPPGIANLTNLIFLTLRSNQFHKSIPVELFSNFHVLQVLDFSDNNLGGSIPVEIRHLVSLQHLNMSTNRFIGALPDSLGNCTQLLSVDFSHNRLNSSIPGKAFATMSSLVWMDLSRNLFSGLWPPQFGELKQIGVINVSANNISGPIPLGLGGCLSLEILDLSFSGLSGAIPQDLGILKHLTSFNASYNNFSGPIPSSGAFRANLTTASFLGNPGLCGGILGPQRLCPVQASPMGRPRCNGFECPKVWISVASALGLVIILLGAWYMTTHCYVRTGGGDLGLVTFTMDPSIRFFTKFDIVAAIGAGEDSVIGRGPNSIVYKANLPGGEIIAIKVLKVQKPSTIDEEKHDAKEILSEAHILARLRHRNIIKVVGLYSTEDIKAILLEYMPKGSLHRNLHGDAPCEFTWVDRFKILLGVTHAMVYLHHEFPDPIIHRDLKPSNILLDADLEPKLCDFGISNFVADDNGDNGEVSVSNICGTVGYMPQYGTDTRASTKGDVYSFGVVLLELLTAKVVTQFQSMTPSGQDEGLVGILQRSFQESKITPGITPLEVLDPILKIEGTSDAIIKQKMTLTLQLGLYCTRALPENRPPMNVVLEFVLKIEKIGQRITERTLDDLLKEGNDVPFSSSGA